MITFLYRNFITICSLLVYSYYISFFISVYNGIITYLNNLI